MTAVEVLAPVRLETRFVAPADRPDGVPQWMLRLRIYPDEFSMPRRVAPPAPAELDRLSEAVASMSAAPSRSELDAFTSFGGAVGAARALWLWRTFVVTDAAGGLSVDRSAEAEHTPFRAHAPAGLPKQLEVWLIHADGTREMGASLMLDLAGIAADLDLAAFDDQAVLASGKLPDPWWLSYPRAVEVGLGVDIDIGDPPPQLDAIVVLGVGETSAADVVDVHNQGGRLAVLAPGTPTNTVAGEATTDFGDEAESLFPLLHVDPASQQSARVVLAGLTGRVPPAALPLLGGDLDYFGPGGLAVQGLWPVLWGRALRDVTGAGEREIALARWARYHLGVEGLRPAIRIGEQPYGLLSTSAFASWAASPGDAEADIEDRIRRWGLEWRAGAAAAARAASPRVPGADTRGLLQVLGLHAPSRHWRVRPIADAFVVAAARALAGMPQLPVEWDRFTAATLRDWPAPLSPIAPAARSGRLPGPPLDEQDDPALLRELCWMEPEPLYFGRIDKLGLVGHLVREALIAARAIVGEAFERLQNGKPVVLDQALPLDDEETYRNFVMAGGEQSIRDLEASDIPAAHELASRFREVQEALEVIADLWLVMPGQLFRGVLAALDTAAFRVDPWLTGIADRRLQQMIREDAPFFVGAYGWVDAPAPFAGIPGGSLAPGPTTAGLLHAPSHAQALTAAMLRDAAVRNPGEDRWNLAIDSAKVRASIALAERVRLGVHPYEALGLEVEEVAGDWDSVRILRQNYPLASDQQERRVCDGAKVLRAAREGTLVAGLAADLAARLAPLDDVLDTYADLLVADGVHALVTGHADLSNAAMEAAAGLGAPPELRAIRTPRAATTVRVSAWALLPPGAAPAGPGADSDPAAVADPAYAALVSAEIGADALHSSDPAARDARNRIASLLGGGDDPLVPSLTGGAYAGLPSTADSDLRAAVASDLGARLASLRQLAEDARDALLALDPDAPTAGADVSAEATRWAVDLSGVAPTDPLAETPATADLRAALVGELADRLVSAKVPGAVAASPIPDPLVNAMRRAIRTLAGRPDLPVLPIVPRALVPTLTSAPDVDRSWLELVAAVRPRLAWLEARQLDPELGPWPAAVAAPGGSADPWHKAGPVLVAYSAGVAAAEATVAIAVLDAWMDSVPSRRHATTAAFGFNAPKSRAPQAVLLAVPPDPAQRLDNTGLLDVILETRDLVHARAARPTDLAGLPYASPFPLVHAAEPVSVLEGWPA